MQEKLSMKELSERYEGFKSKKLNLNMTRGVPCKAQLDLSNDIITMNLDDTGYMAKGIGDCRSYGGGPAGTVEARELFAQLFGAEGINEVIVLGNSSLNIMYDTMLRNMYFGADGESKPWKEQGRVKFLCPVPGYDRHFAICETLGIEMINIPMTKEGPDMAEVKRLAESDPLIKGIWCVPKYSNPDGVTYSDAVVHAFAALRPAAPDFRIFWDNAYIVHDLKDKSDELLNLFAELKKCGREDMIYMFASTSKITLPGSGIAGMCASERNIKYILEKMFFQTICPDKTNQLRHVKFLCGMEGIKAQMSRHKAILSPKFSAVVDGFEKEFAPYGICRWTDPNGGYFISLFTPDNCASRAVKLCAQAGVALTPAGATYPYRKDPADNNIRISPTFPSVDDLATAIEVLCVCVKIAYLETL